MIRRPTRFIGAIPGQLRGTSRGGELAIGILAVMAALASGFVAIGCVAPKTAPLIDPDTVGSVELGIQFSGGVTLSLVDFRISGNGINPIAGSIAVSDTAATASTFVSGIAPASGYQVDMTSASGDGKTTCAGTGTFDAQAGQTSSLTVLILCRTAPDAGGVTVIVGGTINNCPQLTTVSASPASVLVGGTINLQAAAMDLDPGDTLSFVWTATSGSFAHPSSAQTSFLCTAAGSPALTINVSDGRCSDNATFEVSCLAPACGNSVVEPGEQCDPPNGTTCNSLCKTISTGTNGSDSGAIGTGDAASADAGAAGGG